MSDELLPWTATAAAAGVLSTCSARRALCTVVSLGVTHSCVRGLGSWRWQLCGDIFRRYLRLTVLPQGENWRGSWGRCVGGSLPKECKKLKCKCSRCGTISWNDIMTAHGRAASVKQRASTLLIWAVSLGCCVCSSKQCNAQRGFQATADSHGYAAGCRTKAQACGAGRTPSENCSRCSEFPRSAF